MRTLISASALTALALGTAQAAEKTQNVEVQASRIVQKSAGYGPSHIPITQLTLSYEVSVDDLDLSTPAGLQSAETRIRNAAAAACEELGKKAPEATPDNAQCAKASAKAALARLHSSLKVATK